MTRTTGFLGALAVAMLFSGGGALAQGVDDADRLDRLFGQIDRDGSGTITEDEMRAAAAARFAALDRDGDGTVGGSERRATRESRLEAVFAEADRDANGVLDAAEVVEVAKRRALRRLSQLDSDGDGMLSLGELQRLRADPTSGGTTMTLARLEAQMMAMFRRVDADGDGIVTRREATDGAGR